FLTLFVYVFAQDTAPTDIDSLFRANEFRLPDLDSSYRVSYNETAQGSQTQGKDEVYTLQFDALANFDAAQARRAKLQAQTGYGIHMVFDAPFYKLRGGHFKKKSDAEDKARELSLYNISAFAVKIR
ncbi:MAG: SPOR domain-containing protein, partial [Fibromonadales bacterium]|nr:SPOR domain-containing protein [Fibromonadales bacterium]